MNEWLNSPQMQDYIALASTPHFIIFVVIEVIVLIAITRNLKNVEQTGNLSKEERDTFKLNYGSREKRSDMPTKYADYAEAYDDSLKSTIKWLALSSIGVLILFYKLLELYAL